MFVFGLVVFGVIRFDFNYSLLWWLVLVCWKVGVVLCELCFEEVVLVVVFEGVLVL